MDPDPDPTAAANTFPGLGRSYLVKFPAFRFHLHFESLTQATWVQILEDGSRGPSETVPIRLEPMGHSIFIVTWQEKNKTTVVSVEDLAHQVVVTNITRADQTFLQARGTMTELP